MNQPALEKSREDATDMPWRRAAVSKALQRKVPAVPKSRIQSLVQIIFGFVGTGSGRAQSVDAVINELEADISALLETETKADESDKDKLAVSAGKGLGPRIDVKEGSRRLAQYARIRPLESWAGDVATAGELQKKLGIPRSTLSVWRRNNSVIGLKRDLRNYVYPLDQFVDGHPLEGISEVLSATPGSKEAWLWLSQAHATLDGLRPIDALKKGLLKKVASAAMRDFI